MYGTIDNDELPVATEIFGSSFSDREKVYYVTDFNDSPDFFVIDNSTNPYFEAYLHDNQLESLIVRYFEIDYMIVRYAPDCEDDYFDIQDSKTLAIKLYGITEVDPF